MALSIAAEAAYRCGHGPYPQFRDHPSDSLAAGATQSAADSRTFSSSSYRMLSNVLVHTCLQRQALASDPADIIGMRLAIQGGTCALVPIANLYKKQDA